MKAQQLTTSALLLLLLGLGTACGGEPDPTDGAYGALIEYVLPDHRVPESVWQLAPPSCEGVLSDDMIRVGSAENAPALGVVLDSSGDALCVDTWFAISIEIDRIKGDPSPDPMLPMFEPPIEMPGEPE